MKQDIQSKEQLVACYLDCRTFVHQAQSASASAGLGPRQFELLVTVSHWDKPKGPTVRNIAEALRIRHNTTVELIDRTVERGAIERTRDGADRRKVYVRITEEGERLLQAVTEEFAGTRQEHDTAPASPVEAGEHREASAAAASA